MIKKCEELEFNTYLFYDIGFFEFMTYAIQQPNSGKGLISGLFLIIKLSKKYEEFSVAAANAITILNKANICLSGMDFSGVRISGANL